MKEYIIDRMSAGRRKGNGLASRGIIVDETRDLALLNNLCRNLKIGTEQARGGVHAQ